MRRFDFRCGDCGQVAADVVLPADQSPRTHAPLCRVCGRRTAWMPSVNMSIIADTARHPVHIQNARGEIETHEVASLADIRRLERESEHAYRNGEGQPLRWRAYSQDDSNRDVHSFGPDPSERPDPAFVKRAKPRVLTEAEVEKLGTYGPGVSAANTSALPPAVGK